MARSGRIPMTCRTTVRRLSLTSRERQNVCKLGHRYRHADGSWHWARQHGVASRDETGRACRVSGSTGDITTEKRLGSELDRVRRQLGDALESIAEGFVLFDPEDRLVMCNSHYRALFTDVAHMVRPGNSVRNPSCVPQ